MNEKITPYQLFFLTFSYLLSGFFLGGMQSFAMAMASFFALCLYAYLAYRGCASGRRNVWEFFGALFPERVEKLVFIVFLTLTWMQFLPTAVLFSKRIHALSDFLPLWFVGISLTAAAFFVAARGFSTVGRLSELLLFLLVPLLLTRPFFHVEPAFQESAWDAEGALSFVSIAPIFYLLSKTATAGDRDASHSLRVSRGAIANRGRYVLSFLLGGGALAVAVWGILLLFEIRMGDVLFRLLFWWTAFVRLALLASVFVDVMRGEGRAVKTVG